MNATNGPELLPPMEVKRGRGRPPKVPRPPAPPKLLEFVPKEFTPEAVEAALEEARGIVELLREQIGKLKKDREFAQKQLRLRRMELDLVMKRVAMCACKGDA